MATLVVQKNAQSTTTFGDLKECDFFTTKKGGLFMKLKEIKNISDVVVLAPTTHGNSVKAGEIISWFNKEVVIPVTKIEYTAVMESL